MMSITAFFSIIIIIVVFGATFVRGQMVDTSTSTFPSTSTSFTPETSTWTTSSTSTEQAATTTATATSVDALKQYTLVFTGVPSSQPRRFSTAFTTSAIIHKLKGRTVDDCATLCSNTVGCWGVFAYTPSSDKIQRCHTLNDLGVLGGVDTGSNSISYKNNSPLQPKPFLRATDIAGVEVSFLGRVEGVLDPRRFPTAFDEEVMLKELRDVDTLECILACLGEPACFGIFALLRGEDRICRLLSDIGNARGVFTNSRSISYSRQSFDVSEYVDTVDGFTLNRVGAIQGAPTGSQPQRFSTMFNAEATIKVSSGVTLEGCAAECDDLFHCQGFSYWIPSITTPRCILLADIGRPVSTASASLSFARHSSNAQVFKAPQGFVTLYEGVTPTNDGVSYRFSTGFTSSEHLNVVEVDFDTSEECALLCLANDQCEGYFYWILDEQDQRCVLLSSIGVSPLSTSSNSYSVARIPTGYELRFVGQVPYNQDSPRRFSTAFDSNARIASFTGLSLHECAAQCSQEQFCVGIFMWLRQGRQHVCFLLNNLGTADGVPTASYSFSFRVSGEGTPEF
eukprot:m.239907 g.239907  ORF g.239907 m.239907 type:complete len:567 (+) comp14211_c0_seq1:433-2133(+)